jgi:hypothetical protein
MMMCVVCVVRMPVRVAPCFVFKHAALCAMMRSAQEIGNFLELVQQLICESVSLFGHNDQPFI